MSNSYNPAKEQLQSISAGIRINLILVRKQKRGGRRETKSKHVVVLFRKYSTRVPMNSYRQIIGRSTSTGQRSGGSDGVVKQSTFQYPKQKQRCRPRRVTLAKPSPIHFHRASADQINPSKLVFLHRAPSRTRTVFDLFRSILSTIQIRMYVLLHLPQLDEVEKVHQFCGAAVEGWRIHRRDEPVFRPGQIVHQLVSHFIRIRFEMSNIGNE